MKSNYTAIIKHHNKKHITAKYPKKITIPFLFSYNSIMNSSFLKSDSFIYIKLYHFFLYFSMIKLVFPRTNIANITSSFLVIFISYFTCMYILFLLLFMIRYIIMSKQKYKTTKCVYYNSL